MSQKVASGPKAANGPIQIIPGTIANGNSQSFSFLNNIQEAIVAITSFQLQYQDGEDHNVKSINVSVNPSVNGNAVNVQATALMQDNNNHLAPGAVSFQIMAVLDQ